MSNSKPLILSLESSGATCAAALSDGRDLIAEYSLYGQNMHDRLLADFVRRIFADNNLAPDAPDAVAVSSGPGSFTGLRIGAAAAKGLCFGGSPLLIAVPTLAALAWSARETAKYAGCGRILASILSYRDNIYYQEYDLAGKSCGEVISTKLADLDQFRRDDIFAVGTAFAESEGFNTAVKLNRLTACSIADLAYVYYENGEFIDPEDFVPMYIQDFKPRGGGRS